MTALLYPSHPESSSASAAPGTEQLNTLTRCCAGAIQSTGEYAIELQSGDAEPLRSELNRCSSSVLSLSPLHVLEAHPTPPATDVCRSVREGVEIACRAYQLKSQARLVQLKRQIRTASEAVQAGVVAMAENIGEGNSVHEAGVRERLQHLQAMSERGDLPQIHGALGLTVQEIRRSHLQLQRAHQWAVLQLQDEIRVLRDAIDEHQAAREKDPDLGVWRRGAVDQEILSRIEKNMLFSVLVLSLHNLKELQKEHSTEAIQRLLHAFLQQLRGIVGPEASIGWRRSEAFAVILPTPPTEAPRVCEKVGRHLPGSFRIQTGGKSLTLALDVSVQVLDIAGRL